jgi:hypothetical protein
MTKIELYSIPWSPRLRIKPGEKARNWMSPYAYRCLPISAANALGWDIICTEEVSFDWNGGPDQKDVVVNEGTWSCHSNFGLGSVTFPVGYVWRTEPGVHLMVMPPVNSGQLLFHTISTVIETDVLKYPWFLTIRAARRGTVTLPPGTILARVIPVRMADVIDADIEVLPEPEDYLLTRQDHTEARDATQGKSEWLRFYHDEVTHKAVRTPEVKQIEEQGGENGLRKNAIYTVPKYLSEGEAKIVADFIRVAPERPQSDPNWIGRTRDFDATSFEPDLYETLTAKLHRTVERSFGRKLQMEHPHLVIWDVGHQMRPHSDHSKGMYPDREIAALIYLTDDYKGGTVFFPALEIELTPRIGQFICFPGGKLFHGVREVTEGQRLTLITWFKDIGPLEG